MRPRLTIVSLAAAMCVSFASFASFAACAVPASFACAENKDCARDEECGDDLICRDKPPALGLEGEGEGNEGEGEGNEGEGEGEGNEGEGEGEGEPCLPIAGATVATFQQHCYVAFADNDSWAGAVVRCAALGGYLAVPSSPPEHELIGSSLVPIGFDPFIGITDAHDEGVFTSIVGESMPTDLTPFFNDGEPNDGQFGTEDDCVHYLETDDANDVDPEWNDEECITVADGDANVTSALCELPFDGVEGFCGDGIVQAAFGECAPAPDPGSCPADCAASFTPDVGYEALDDRVLIGFARTRSFAEALVACEVLGGTLAHPDSPESDERVTRIIARLGGAALWIGYQDRFFDEAGNNAQDFRRVDDDQPIGDGFEAFGTGEPNDFGDEDCVEALGTAGWNDNDCSESRGFVCELK